MEKSSARSRLLLVDGDPKSLRVLDVSLKKAGFDVLTASSGRAALALLEEQTPDLIICDTDLEGMDGFELCKQIKARAEWAKIPFLFVSGRKSIEDKIRGLELGVEDYLTKPIYIREIGIRVRTALQRSDREKMESKRDSRTRFAGDLSDVSVVDLVQTIELNRKSGIVHIIAPEGQRGSIFFRDGRVIDAEVGKLSGANAVYRLFGWSEGQFAVEFKPIRRFDIIDLPVTALLMEGMRRLDESTRLLEKLPPLRSVVDVDFRVLAEELAELPDEMNGILRLFDGSRTLQQVIEDGDYPDLEALSILARLSENKILFARDLPSPSGSSAETSDKLAQWLSETKPEDGAMAEHAATGSEIAEESLDRLTDGEAVSTPSPKPKHRTAETMRGFATKEDLSQTQPGFMSVLLGGAHKTPKLVSQGSEGGRRTTESFGEALVSEIEAGETGGVVIDVGATLKGVPVTDASNRTGPAVGLGTATPQIDVLGEKKDAVQPEAHHERRITASLGLAERILSDDSSVRAMALVEPGTENDQGVVLPSNSDRKTKEYGNSPEDAAAIEYRGPSSETQQSKELAPQKPSKEVDWGPFSTEGAGAPEQSIVGATPLSLSVIESTSPFGLSPDRSDDGGNGRSISVGAQASGPVEQQVVVDASLSKPMDRDEPAATTASETKSPASHKKIQDAPARAPVKAFASQPGSRSARKTTARWEVVLLLGILVAGLSATYFLVRSWSSQTEGAMVAERKDVAAPLPTSNPVAMGATGSAIHKPVVDAGLSPTKGVAAAVLEPNARALKDQCIAVDADGKGRTKEVSNACRVALGANPEDAEVLFLLARAELDRGKLVEARTLARKATVVKPDLVDSFVLLGSAEQELGRIEEAKAAYRKYLELAPQGRHARELRAILSNL